VVKLCDDMALHILHWTFFIYLFCRSEARHHYMTLKPCSLFFVLDQSELSSAQLKKY